MNMVYVLIGLGLLLIVIGLILLRPFRRKPQPMIQKLGGEDEPPPVVDDEPVTPIMPQVEEATGAAQLAEVDQLIEDVAPPIDEEAEEEIAQTGEGELPDFDAVPAAEPSPLQDVAEGAPEEAVAQEEIEEPAEEPPAEPPSPELELDLALETVAPPLESADKPRTPTKRKKRRRKKAPKSPIEELEALSAGLVTEEPVKSEEPPETPDIAELEELEMVESLDLDEELPVEDAAEDFEPAVQKTEEEAAEIEVEQAEEPVTEWAATEEEAPAEELKLEGLEMLEEESLPELELVDLEGADEPASEAVDDDWFREVVEEVEREDVSPTETPARPQGDAARPAAMPGAASSSAASEEERRLERTRRLARVIVNDIKLYYPEKLELGVRQGNIREILADEIRRGRRLFLERASKDIPNRESFFEESLLQILAGGNEQILGPTAD